MIEVDVLLLQQKIIDYVEKSESYTKSDKNYWFYRGKARALIDLGFDHFVDLTIPITFEETETTTEGKKQN